MAALRAQRGVAVVMVCTLNPLGLAHRPRYAEDSHSVLYRARKISRSEWACWGRRPHRVVACVTQTRVGPGLPASIVRLVRRCGRPAVVQLEPKFRADRRSSPSRRRPAGGDHHRRSAVRAGTRQRGSLQQVLLDRVLVSFGTSARIGCGCSSPLTDTPRHERSASETVRTGWPLTVVNSTTSATSATTPRPAAGRLKPPSTSESSPISKHGSEGSTTNSSHELSLDLPARGPVDWRARRS